MKKAILWMVALCLVALQACQKEENTPTVIGTGTCGAQGDNLTWTLDEDGILTIKGEGDMEDYEYDEHPSWGIYFKKISAVVIQDGVTSIGNYAFYECEYLTTVSIPSSVTSIGDDAFEYCENLTSVNIPESVTRIGEYAFSDCTGLTSVTISKGLTSIEGCVFSGCESLSSVTISENIRSIDWLAFGGCTGLAEIKVEAVVPPSIVAGMDDVSEWEGTFAGVDPSIPVYVPASSVSAYQSSLWGLVFSNIQPM